MENKIKDCINRLLEFPELFTINIQTNQHILQYFKSNFQCKYFQKSFYEFLALIDGITMPEITIFSIKKENGTSFSLSFEDYSKDSDILEYCKGISKLENKDWLFIGTDNKGGRFAISKTVPNDEVFYFNKSVNSSIVVYDDFASLLKEMIERTITQYI